MSHNPVWTALHEVKCADVATDASDIMTVKASEPLDKIVKQLASKKVLSAPVIAEGGKCIGTVDLQDLIWFLASAISPDVPADTAERNITLRSAAEVIKMSPRDTFTPLDPHDKCTLATELFATGIHRCPLTDSDDKLAGLLTQVDLVMHITKDLREGAAKGMGAQTLEALGLGMTQPVEVAADQQVGDTVAQLDGYQVSALPVVNAKGELTGNFSVTDLINIWTDKDGISKALSMTVTDYLKKHHAASLKPLTCKRSDSLVDTAAYMVEKQVHRLWVVDKSNKPIGVVSMTDIFKVVRDHVDISTGDKPHKPRESFGCMFRALEGGKVISVNKAGNAVEVLDAASDEHSLWTLEHLPNSAVAFKAANGKYLSVDAKHQVGLAAKRDANETFNLVESDTGAVALHDAQGGFLEIKGNKVMSHKSKNDVPTRKQWLKMTKAFANK